MQHGHVIPSLAALAALCACVLTLVAAAPAGARPADDRSWRGPTPQISSPPVVKEIVVRPEDEGPARLVIALLGAGAAFALMGVAYAGTRFVNHAPDVSPH